MLLSPFFFFVHRVGASIERYIPPELFVLNLGVLDYSVYFCRLNQYSNI